ncbi:MAG: hypothetical protein H6814_11260 [Phycisphaeraceae bacterium]|nr:hypothetical protein [Phycisphaeraceae bacterium]
MKPDLLTVARPLAPEDINTGMYVAVLHEHRTMIPFYLADTVYEIEQVRPISWRTPPAKTRPLKVVSVCVPYVLAERPCGKSVTLDVRQTSLARLSDSFGKASFKRLRPRKKRRPDADRKSGDAGGRRNWLRFWRRPKSD